MTTHPEQASQNLHVINQHIQDLNQANSQIAVSVDEQTGYISLVSHPHVSGLASTAKQLTNIASNNLTLAIF